MALEKLKISVEVRPNVYSARPFEVLFNPTELKLDKNAHWVKLATSGRDTARAGFSYSDPYTLSLDLFFDTYEKKTNVRDYVREVAALATVQGDLHRPPRCKLAWGKNDFGGFQWVLESLSQRFTLFLPNGTPVRATLSCMFKQWRSAKEEALEVKRSSPDVAKTRVVRRGETLSSIAAEEYNDPSLWRPIAELNRIHNPRKVVPGQVLAIPPLQPGRKSGS
ncbi:MAG TPA: LysM peptidoglycan-binding domain-containing protein [Thermoanaerobaculia bacterium]|nr:LysM peptidoglycan-binding domain-containing protein [Thermoanaerobaculia bacterium]